MSIKSYKVLRRRAGGATERRKRTELSEMVTRRARDTAALVASIRVRKADVAAALGQRFTPALRAGETVPDYELTLELAGRSVQLAFDRLDELDDSHFIAKAKRAHQAREVDCVAKQELYPQAVDVRRQIDAAFGREAGSDLHSFTGKTPRTAARLRQHVLRAVARLGNPNRELPARQLVAGESVDRDGRPEGVPTEDWRRRLEGPLGKLVAAVEHLSRLEAELDAVSGKRNQAMQHFDAVYAESLRLVEAAFVMAGIRGQMLKSLRPYYWRRGLALWARKKREARADRQAAAEASPAAAVPAEMRRRSAKGAFAAASRWLMEWRVFS